LQIADCRLQILKTAGLETFRCFNPKSEIFNLKSSVWFQHNLEMLN